MSVIPSAKVSPLILRPAVSRLLLIALFAEIGYAVLNISTMQVYLRDDRKFTESVFGFVLVSYLFFEAVFKGPMGQLADRFGPKRLMLIGPSLSVLTAILSLCVPHTGGQPMEFLAFLGLRAIDGIGAAMLWPAAFSAMGAAVNDDERQQGMSLLNLCYMLGIALAFPIGGILNDVTGVKWASLILAAALFAAVAICVWRLMPDVHVQHTESAEPAANIKDLLASLKQIPAYLLLSIVTFAGIGFPMAIFKLFSMDEFHFSETQVGGLIFPGAIAMAAASVPMSKYGERIGRIRAVHVGMGMCAIGLWFIAIGGFLPFMRHWWVLAACGIPVGIGFLLTIPAWMATVSDIDSKRRGANLGAVMTAQGLGAIIGTPIGSALYDKLAFVDIHGEVNKHAAHYAPFVGCAACVTLGWLIGLRLLRDPQARSLPTPS